MICKIYEENRENPCYEEAYKTQRVFLIKSSECKMSVTPHRQIVCDPLIYNELEKEGYVDVLPHKIDDIVKHIIMLRSAKHIITSYGGANCCNRFFFHPLATVKVICNQHYKSEYALEWHPRCSIYVAKKYILYLDMPNILSVKEIQKILHIQ